MVATLICPSLYGPMKTIIEPFIKMQCFSGSVRAFTVVSKHRDTLLSSVQRAMVTSPCP